MDAILNDQMLAEKAKQDEQQGAGSVDAAAAKQQNRGGAAGLNTKPYSTKSTHFVDLAMFDKTWRKPRRSSVKGLSVKAWDPTKVRKQVEAHNDATGYADSQSRARDAAVFRSMATKGPWKACALPDDVQGSIERLSQEFPHWQQAVNVVVEQLLLSIETRTPPRVPPMLLIGPPGVGKTHFARRVAQVFRAPVQLIDYSSQQTNSCLHGNDRHWSNSRYGVLFEQIVMGDCANPILILDEIDKARTLGSDGYHALAPLHMALEPSTARTTRDLSADIEFDASFVTYIATANSLSKLPDSLLSRMHLIYCPAADASLAYDITKSVIAQVMSSGPGRHFEPVSRNIVRELAEHTPREVTKMLQRAMGRATRDGRRYLKLADIQAHVEDHSIH
jgi:ATP-dependent Lon protease